MIKIAVFFYLVFPVWTSTSNRDYLMFIYVWNRAPLNTSDLYSNAKKSEHWKWYCYVMSTVDTRRFSSLNIIFFEQQQKKNRDLNDLYATAYKFMLWQFYSGRDDELPTSLLYSLSISVLSIYANQFWSSSCLWLCHICMREQHFPSRKTYIQLENRKEVLFQFCRCRNYPLLLHLHISY